MRNYYNIICSNKSQYIIIAIYLRNISLDSDVLIHRSKGEFFWYFWGQEDSSMPEAENSEHADADIWVMNMNNVNMTIWLPLIKFLCFGAIGVGPGASIHQHVALPWLLACNMGGDYSSCIAQELFKLNFKWPYLFYWMVENINVVPNKRHFSGPSPRLGLSRWAG